MARHFLFFCFFCASILPSSGKEVILSGCFQDSLLEDSVHTVIAYYLPSHKAMLPPINYADRYDSAVSDGRFEFVLEDVAPLGYLVLYYHAGRAQLPKSSRTLVMKHLLVEPGMRVSMTIAKDSVQFSGPGKDLLACQFELYTEELRRIGISEPDPYLARVMNMQQSDSILARQLSTLNAYSSRIGEVAHGVLTEDFISDRNKKCLLIDFVDRKDSISLAYNKAVFQFYADYFLFNDIDITLSELKSLSRSFANWALIKSIYDMRISAMASGTTTGFTFDKLFETVNKRFDGTLRERLLVAGFSKYYKGVSESDSLLSSLLRNMKSSEYKMLITGIYNSTTVGKQSYDFALPDTAGTVFTKDMFLGKVMVLDFWFTGCYACALLKKKMEPVIDYFLNDDRVVLINVSVDKDKTVFRKSVGREKYTHAGGINLYTGGLGRDHPIIRYYGIDAFPTLLVIDKSGEILAWDPLAKGRSAENLIQLIKNELD